MTANRTTKKASSKAEMNRQFKRVRQWAEQQSHEVLAVHFAGVLTTLLHERKRARKLSRVDAKIAQLKIGQLEDQVIKEVAQRIAIELGETWNRKRGALVRHANDPKQAAKAGALELWMERHAGKHPKLRTVDQFAMEVIRRWPVLQSIGTIREWSRKWSKQVREGEAPTC